MNQKTAWKNFEKSGEIADQLEYRKCEEKEEQVLGKKSKSKWNNNCGK